MTQGERTIGLVSAAPTALGSSSGSISQPFRAGLTFGGRPSGPYIYGNLCRLPTRLSESAAPRNDKKERVVVKERAVAKGNGVPRRRCKLTFDNRLPFTFTQGRSPSTASTVFVRKQKSHRISPGR